MKSEVVKASGITVHCAHTKIVEVESLVKNPRNPNKHPDNQIALLSKIIRDQGWRNPIVVSDRSGFIVKGHGRLEAALVLQVATVPVDVQHYENEAQEWADLIADNRIAELAEIQKDILSELLEDSAFDGFDMDLTGFDCDSLAELIDEESGDGLTDDDAVPDDVESVVKSGQVWQLGEHRLMCGDSTSVKDVAELMDGKKASLLHADPPYGMGKEGDGVANDNLYREKLDKFQMEWWAAFRPSLKDNASAYIWGNSPDLWRLWYSGGLSASERFELRNQIVWDKKCIPGMKSDLMTQFPIATEHALYFQFGQQFLGNINASDYPEEYEEIRGYLAKEAEAAGVGAAKINELCGCKMYSHWFTKSQFALISERHYKTIQAACVGSFTKPWGELKAAWDRIKGNGRGVLNKKLESMRSYFDNGHDIMYDVWSFSRVTGDERCGHATPKPVDMMERVMKSSLPTGGLCAEPFGGSGSTLIGAEKTGRVCFIMEMQACYCDVIIKRWEDFTGKKAKLVEQ